MKSPREAAHALCLKHGGCYAACANDEHSNLCDDITAAIEARDAEHAAAFEALEEHVACRQHIDCVAADMAHMNAFGELASHGSLLDQARRAIDAAAPAVVPAETPPSRLLGVPTTTPLQGVDEDVNLAPAPAVTPVSDGDPAETKEKP